MEIKTMENIRYKILLVEDNELDQMAFKRCVDDNAIPYDCTIAGSVSEARDALNCETFDIIIADHSLGDGTAFDILDSAKDTPIIVVTGAGDEETAIKVWKAGAYDYLIKDLDQNYLKAIPITVENAVSHKMVEKKLQLLSGAVMSTDDSVYITDTQGRIIFVNKAFCNTYGYEEQEIIGKNSAVLWIGKHQNENTRSVFQTRTVGSSWEVGFYHKRKDDSVFPVSLSRSTIKDSNGNEVAIVGVARDISERIFIEDELRTENQNLKKQITELEEKLGIEHSYSAPNA
jgi:PAS domain S-box-containing protein